MSSCAVCALWVSPALPDQPLTVFLSGRGKCVCRRLVPLRLVSFRRLREHGLPFWVTLAQRILTELPEELRIALSSNGLDGPGVLRFYERTPWQELAHFRPTEPTARKRLTRKQKITDTPSALG